MKNLLIRYNLIFFIIGNLLVPNLHVLLAHDHHGHEHEDQYTHTDCHECIITELTNNCILNSCEVDFSNNNSNILVCEYFSIIEFQAFELYFSRAPPIS